MHIANVLQCCYCCFLYIINYKEVPSGCSGYGGDAIASYNYYFLFIPLLFLFHSLIYKECYNNCCKTQQYISYFVAVLHRLQINVVRCLVIGVLVYSPTDKSEHRVPASCTECSVQKELAKVHARESGRNTDELTHGRNQTAEEC